MAITNSSSLPLTLFITSATPHEIKLVKGSLSSRFIKKLPKQLIGDRAYDSDPLDKMLAKHNVEMIAPHKKTEEKIRKPKTAVH